MLSLVHWVKLFSQMCENLRGKGYPSTLVMKMVMTLSHCNVLSITVITPMYVGAWPCPLIYKTTPTPYQSWLLLPCMWEPGHTHLYEATPTPYRSHYYEDTKNFHGLNFYHHTCTIIREKILSRPQKFLDHENFDAIQLITYIP